MTWLDNDKKAMILMIIGTSSFSAGFIYCNQHKFHPIQTTLSRGLMVTILSAILMKYLSLDFCFKSTHNLKWLLIRNSIMVLHNYVYSFVQYYLPLPIAITLNAISPVFVCVYDYLIYGVKINKIQTIALIVSLVGVFLTANGPYLVYLIDPSYELDDSKFTNYQTKDPVVMTWAAVIMVIMMAIHSSGVIMTKKLRGVHTAEVNFIQGLMIFFSGAIAYPSILQPHNYSQPQISTFIVSLFVSGIPMAIGQLSYIGALILTKNLGLVTALSFSSIILGFLISILRYGQEVNPIGVIGSLTIIVGIVWMVVSKDKPQK